MPFSNLTVLGVNERSQLAANNRLIRVVIIDIQTSLNNVGQLTIPVSEYEKLDDNQLAERIAQKAAMLDRAQLL